MRRRGQDRALLLRSQGFDVSSRLIEEAPEGRKDRKLVRKRQYRIEGKDGVDAGDIAKHPR